MTFVRALAFLTLGFADVRVHAERFYDGGAGGRAFRMGETKYSLGRDGLARASEANGTPALHLVRGRLLVSGGATIVTPFAKFSCAGSCTAIFARDELRVTIDTLSDGWSVVRTGETQGLAVGPARRVRLGEVSGDGRAEILTVETTAWAALVRDWASLHRGSSTEFAGAVRAFRPVWAGAVEDLSRAQAGRAVAMIERRDIEVARRQTAAREAALEDQRIRAEFRARNFVD